VPKHIREGNDFWNGSDDLIMGSSRRGLPYWLTRGVREWQRDYDDPETICPHIMVVMCSGAEAKDGELLFSELGSIAQMMQRRLDQEEFKKTSLFPVAFPQDH
jgi:hypothetical protein